MMNYKLTIRYMTFLMLFAAGIFTVQSCKMSNTAKGAAIGTATGGAIGAAIGHTQDNTAVGALIGAAVGGSAGALIGRRMDKQAEELKEDLEGAEVSRVGEGILVTFEDGMTFDKNSANLGPTSIENLDDLSEVLKKYEKTEVLIEGHTSSPGSNEYNMELSEERAKAAQRFLITEGVQPTRLTAVGYGEEQPIADNDTETGRELNRRVEVAIYANDKMKKLAKKGELGEVEEGS